MTGSKDTNSHRGTMTKLPPIPQGKQNKAHPS